MKSLDQYWYSQNLLAWMLLPLSYIFRATAVLRYWMYKARLFPSTRLAVPVIVVGNIAVGGTGKTPLLIALTELLKAAGFRPGLISRGYASTLVGEALVVADSTAAEVGDEPLLIARRTACPVAVGRHRVAAAELLLKNFDCDIILSDDGLQHYALQRDIEIAVVDARRLHGNGYFLPAGPLRESVKRLESVDFVVYNGAADTKYRFDLEMLNAVNLKTKSTVELGAFSAQSVHAIAGIGYPLRFFDQLERAGLKLTSHAFADHHAYSADNLIFDDELPVLMTEKDAVKCSQFNLDNLWAVPVVARITSDLSDDFIKAVRHAIEQHGHDLQ